MANEAEAAAKEHDEVYSTMREAHQETLKVLRKEMEAAGGTNRDSFGLVVVDGGGGRERQAAAVCHSRGRRRPFVTPEGDSVRTKRLLQQARPVKESWLQLAIA